MVEFPLGPTKARWVRLLRPFNIKVCRLDVISAVEVTAFGREACASSIAARSSFFCCHRKTCHVPREAQMLGNMYRSSPTRVIEAMGGVLL